MTREPDSMRARLLQLDSIEQANRAGYDAALRELFDRKLGRGERLRYLLPTVVGLLMALGLASLAWSEPSSTPVATRAVLFVMAGIGAFWFVLCGRILSRGSVNLRHDRGIVVSAALVFTTLQVLFFAWKAQEDSAVLPGLVVSLVFVVLAVAGFVVQRVRESELRVREQILRSLHDAPRNPL